jgi:hypothetical protein
MGDAPFNEYRAFLYSDRVIIYFHAGTTGWRPIYGGRPTMGWFGFPIVRNTSIQTNQFGFAITGTNTQVMVVEACTNLVNPYWLPVATNRITGTRSYFSDPLWANHPKRFYRVHTQ